MDGNPTKIEPQSSKLTFNLIYPNLPYPHITLSFIHSASYRSFMDDGVGGNLLPIKETENHVEQFHQQKQKEHPFRLSFLQSM